MQFPYLRVNVDTDFFIIVLLLIMYIYMLLIYPVILFLPCFVYL